MSFSVLDYADRIWRSEAASEYRPHLLQRHGVMEVADGIGFWPAFGNVFPIRADDALVLFDTGSERAAPAMHAAVRRYSAEPVRYAIYSHGHFDHVFGVAPFDTEARERGWPRPLVVSHEAVVARFKRYLRTAGYNEVINRRQFGVADYRFPREYRMPDVTFRDSMELTHGDLTLRLWHARGETDDHAYLYIPERRALFCGDLFTWVAPNAGNPQKVQRYPDEWAKALRHMASLDADLLLPSHGLPIQGRDRVRMVLTDVAEYLESLVEQTLKLMNEGARLDDIIHTVKAPARLAEKPYLQPRYDEPEFVVRNVWRLYGGWYGGNPASLKPTPDRVLAAALAELAGGAAVLARRAQQEAAEGDLRLAGHLAELAAQAAPDDTGVHEVRAEVFTARAKAEMSTMAKGVFDWAAAESRAKAAGISTLHELRAANKDRERWAV